MVEKMPFSVGEEHVKSRCKEGGLATLLLLLLLLPLLYV